MIRTRRVIRLEPGQQVSAGEHVALVECYGPAGRWNEVTTDPRTNQSGELPAGRIGSRWAVAPSQVRAFAERVAPSASVLTWGRA